MPPSSSSSTFGGGGGGARHCKLSFTPITRDETEEGSWFHSIPRLFLLVELPVLDLVVEAGRLLAGDRVLNGIGSGTITVEIGYYD